MREEREGCMCITNIIPSHQMACFFSYFSDCYFFPNRLSSSPSFFLLLLLCSAPLCSILHTLSFHPVHLQLPLCLLLLCVVVPLHLSFTFSLFPIMWSSGRTNYHQSIVEFLAQQLRSSILHCSSAFSHTWKHKLRPLSMWRLIRQMIYMFPLQTGLLSRGMAFKRKDHLI